MFKKGDRQMNKALHHIFSCLGCDNIQNAKKKRLGSYLYFESMVCKNETKKDCSRYRNQRLQSNRVEGILQDKNKTLLMHIASILSLLLLFSLKQRVKSSTWLNFQNVNIVLNKTGHMNPLRMLRHSRGTAPTSESDFIY